MNKTNKCYFLKNVVLTLPRFFTLHDFFFFFLSLDFFFIFNWWMNLHKVFTFVFFFLRAFTNSFLNSWQRFFFFFFFFLFFWNWWTFLGSCSGCPVHRMSWFSFNEQILWDKRIFSGSILSRNCGIWYFPLGFRWCLDKVSRREKHTVKTDVTRNQVS